MPNCVSPNGVCSKSQRDRNPIAVGHANVGDCGGHLGEKSQKPFSMGEGKTVRVQEESDTTGARTRGKERPEKCSSGESPLQSQLRRRTGEKGRIVGVEHSMEHLNRAAGTRFATTRRENENIIEEKPESRKGFSGALLSRRRGRNTRNAKEKPERTERSAGSCRRNGPLRRILKKIREKTPRRRSYSCCSLTPLTLSQY